MSDEVRLFSVDKETYEKFLDWQDEQERKIAGKYTGAIGGVYTWSFTYTTIGCVVKVTNNLNNETIDLSDYDMW